MPGHRIAMVAAVSAAMIILQICFTRLLAYRLYYHFVFLSISITMLGMSAGTVFVAIRRAKVVPDRFIYQCALAFLALIPACYLLMMKPIVPGLSDLPVKLSGVDAVHAVAWYTFLSFLLNFAGGAILAELFGLAGAQMGKLYAYDLASAGIGCLAGIALMKHFSPPVAYVAAGIPLFAALCIYRRSADLPEGLRRGGLVVSVLSLAGILAISFGPGTLREYRTAATEIYKSEWNHLFRTDHIPGMYILDMDAATVTVKWNAGRPVSSPAFLVAQTEPRVAVIGSGGGLQVADARAARARSILAIDINSTIVRWVLQEDREANGGLFVAPGIRVLEGEGRHSVLSSGETFDLILIHAIDTYSASAAGAYALTENFLYTTEAVQDYLRVLSDNGVVSFSRWMFNPPREDLRLFTTCIESLEASGVSDAASHLIMVAPVADYKKLGSRHVWGHLLLSKSPFTAGQVTKLKSYMDASGWSILHAPGITTDSPFSQYARTPDREGFLEAYPFLVSPVTDRKPYLFQFYNPLRKSSYAATQDQSLRVIYQPSSLLLPLVFGASCVFAFVLVILPLWVRRKANLLTAGLTLRQVFYFGAIGIAFMAVEIPLIQVLSLYLGHPVYGFVYVLTALLMGSGCGSYAAVRFDIQGSRTCRLAALVLVLLGLGLHEAVAAGVAWPGWLKASITAASVLALGFLLGIPLAAGVRRLPAGMKGSVVWAWAVNGAASVVGSTGIMLIMIFLGSDISLFFGAAGYFTAYLCSRAPATAVTMEVQR